MTDDGLNRRVPGAREWTSYQRLVTALHHREPDRVPFDLGGSMVTGINVRALTALRRVLGLPGEAQVLDRVTQMADTGDDVRDHLHVDVRSVRPNAPGHGGPARDLGLVGDHYRLIDEFGMGWQMPRTGGYYYDLYLVAVRNAPAGARRNAPSHRGPGPRRRVRVRADPRDPGGRPAGEYHRLVGNPDGIRPL